MTIENTNMQCAIPVPKNKLFNQSISYKEVKMADYAVSFGYFHLQLIEVKNRVDKIKLFLFSRKIFHFLEKK